MKHKKIIALALIATILLSSGITIAANQNVDINPPLPFPDHIMNKIYNYIVQRLIADFPILTTPLPEDKPEFIVANMFEEEPEINITQTVPFWQDLDNEDVIPEEEQNNVLYGIKYTVNMSVNETGINKEVLFRLKVHTSDNRTFFTNWVSVNTTTPQELVVQERLSDIRLDGRWATGQHDHGLIVDQEYYNITSQAGASLTNATIHSRSVEIIYLSTNTQQ